MKAIRNFFNILYLPLLFIMYFLSLSLFGRGLFNNFGMSMILVIYFFIIYIKNFTKIPKKINAYYIILLCYSFVMTMIGEDWNNFIISIFSVSSFALFIHKKNEDAIIEKSFMIVGVISLIILVMYNHMGSFSGWNPNTIGMACTIGCCCTIALQNITKSRLLKIINYLIILFSAYELILIENRNAVLIFLIVFVLTKFINKSNIYVKKVVSAGIIFSPVILTNILIKIQTSNIFQKLLKFSTKIFSDKDTILSGREIIWQTSERYIGNNWIFGTGKSLYKYLYAHNMYYPVIYSFGIIGYVIYSIFIYYICKYIIEKEFDNISFACIAIGISYFLGQIMENTLFTANFATYLPYMFLSIGLSRIINNEDRMEIENEENNKSYL